MIKNYVLILFFLITYIAEAQTLNYDIISNHFKLGNLTATKTEDKSSIKINIVSQVKIDLLIKTDVTYNVNCIYKNNQLMTSNVTVRENGRIHSINKTENLGTYYLLTDNKHISNYFNKIYYSSALLYFKEPKNISIIFSETDNKNNIIDNIGINEYQITNSENGLKNQYYYKNGILQKAIIHHSLFTFSIIKK